MIKLIKLKENPEYEDLFWKHIYNDILEYYFFILDMTYFREKTEILIAADSKNPSIITGLLLTYHNNVQIRGNDVSIQKFIENFVLTGKDVTIPYGSEKIIFEEYNHSKSETIINRMVYDAERSNINDSQSYVTLSSDNRNEIATLLRTADPLWWGHIDADNLTMDDARIWLGIEKHGKIASTVSAWVHEFAGNIATVATDFKYRKQGYASFLVSTMIRKMLETTKTIIIHVRSDNLSAISVYLKCGFVKGKKFYLIKNVEKR